MTAFEETRIVIVHQRHFKCDGFPTHCGNAPPHLEIARAYPMFRLAVAVHVVHAHEVNPRLRDRLQDQQCVASTKIRGLGNMNCRRAEGNIIVGNDRCRASILLLQLPCDTQGKMRFAGHHNGRSMLSVSRTSQNDT